MLFSLVILGCQSAYDTAVYGTASDFRQIAGSPYHIKFVAADQTADTFRRLRAHAQAHCRSHGKQTLLSSPWTDRSLYVHITFACYLESDKSLLKRLMVEAPSTVTQDFLQQKNVDTSSQINLIADVAKATASASIKEIDSSSSATRTPPGHVACTYRAGQFQWTETLQGVCPASFRKGGLTGVLLP